ncbi:MAG: regulatory protein RecX [Clostridiales bacterium]|nr:regulatory protein RecX [Clostridiales bacterium]
MMITEIIPVTRQKCKIVTDEQLAFVLYKGELSRYRLKEGEELPENVFRKIQQEVLTKRAKLRAMHLLTRMDYTEAELQKKLEKGGYTREAVETAMDYVRSFHYLDDERYAVRYFASQSGKKSRKQIEFELGKKGISRELIAAHKEALEEQGETEVIRSLLEKRCPDPQKADEKEKRKHYGYLMRKGFLCGDIQQVFSDYFERFS